MVLSILRYRFLMSLLTYDDLKRSEFWAKSVGFDQIAVKQSRGKLELYLPSANACTSDCSCRSSGRTKVVDAAGDKEELSDKVCKIADAPVSFCGRVKAI